MTPGEKLVYTLPEAAVLLSLTENWLEERVSAQAIPHHRFGRKIGFTQGDLDELIAQAAVVPVVPRRQRQT